MPEGIGPVTARLRTSDSMRGLVFGSWGEASPDVHQLVSCLAETGARRIRGERGDEDGPCQLRGRLAWGIKRQLAVAAVRSCARLTLARLEHVGKGAAAASAG